LPLVPQPIVRRVAQRYVAGEALEEACDVIGGLEADGFGATASLLGEEVESVEEARGAADEYLRLLDVLAERGLASHVSVKPTHFGLRIAEDLCREQIERVIRAAAERRTFVRIDMEDRTTTDATLRLHRTLRERYDNVGVVLQAYLRRTLADVDALPPGSNVRLCKGIYVEPRSEAWKGYETVRLNFTAVLERLVDRGCTVAVATHDELLACAAHALFERLRVPPARYEYQVLLGVDAELARILRDEGHGLRVYVPYGRDWYAYSLRRLRENPQIAVYVLRALFSR
jgi:proline dehydrogenase